MWYCLEMSSVHVMAEPAAAVSVSLCVCVVCVLFLLLEIREPGTLELFMLLFL